MSEASKPHSEPDEQKLSDFIDMEAYDVVDGERHRALVAQFERELIAARIDKARLEEQLEATQNALRGLVTEIERALLIEFEHGYADFEAALHEADRVLSNPAREPS